jgi:hypothetical protein
MLDFKKEELKPSDIGVLLSAILSRTEVNASGDTKALQLFIEYVFKIELNKMTREQISDFIVQLLEKEPIKKESKVNGKNRHKNTVKRRSNGN